MSKKSKENPDLTDQQLMFCREYIKDLNATKAAERAGYSEKTAQEQSSRLLSKVMIQDAVQKELEARSKRVLIDADYVLTTIKETVERCKQAEPVIEFDYDTKTMVATGEYKFEHSGVLKGCELLGKNLKLWTDKIEVTDTTSRAEKISRARKRVKSD